MGLLPYDPQLLLPPLMVFYICLLSLPGEQSLGSTGKEARGLNRYLNKQVSRNHHKQQNPKLAFHLEPRGLLTSSVNHCPALSIRAVGSTLASWGVGLGSSALPAVGTVLIPDQPL